MVTPEPDFLNSKMFTLSLPIDLYVDREEGAAMGTVARPKKGELLELTLRRCGGGWGVELL